MGIIGKRTDYVLFPSGSLFDRKDGGFNPLNPGSGNKYHLKVTLDGVNYGEGPRLLLLSSYVTRILTSPNVKMELWLKHNHDPAVNEVQFTVMIWRGPPLGPPPPTDSPYLMITDYPIADKIVLDAGKQLAGSGDLISSVNYEIPGSSSEDIVGVRGWAKDIGGGDTQFLAQWYNGSSWQTFANVIFTGMEGVIGEYWVYPRADPLHTSNDAVWLDDFLFEENSSPPDPPPP